VIGLLLALASAVAAAPEDLDPYLPWVVSVDPVTPIPGEPVRVTYSGALVDRPELTIVYGFDGWQHLTAGGGFVEAPQDADGALWEARRPLTRDGDHAWVDLDTPADLRALHFWFEDPATGDRDDRDGLHYGWDAVFPYIGPFLGWDEQVDPTSGVIVAWETSVPCLGVVAHGPDPEVTERAVGTVRDTMHRVALTDLPAGTDWYYQVWDCLGRSSEVASFRTADVDAQRFDWLVMADMQDSGRDDERWSDVVAAALDHPDARFVFAPGDLACNDVPGWWWVFFDRARPLFASVPLVPAPGNHDTPDKESNPDTTHFARYFGVGGAYEQAYGNTRLIALNTEAPAELQPGGAQHDWLGERFADDPPDDRWIVAGMHHPAWDASDRFPDEQLVYRPVGDHLDGNADVVFQAHVHLYQRWHPVHGDDRVARYGTGPNGGPVYVIVPTAGSMLFDRLMLPSDPLAYVRDALVVPATRRDTIEVPSEHGYVSVQTRGRRMTVTTWGLGDGDGPSVARPIDVFTLDRDATACGCGTGPRGGAMASLAALVAAARRRVRNTIHTNES
jgi:hypothetical protein